MIHSCLPDYALMELRTSVSQASGSIAERKVELLNSLGFRVWEIDTPVDLYKKPKGPLAGRLLSLNSHMSHRP